MANIYKSKPIVRLGNSRGYMTLYGKTAEAVELITLVVTIIAAINYLAKAVK